MELQARKLASAALDAFDVRQAMAHLAPVMADAADPETYCMYARLLLVDGDAEAALDALRNAEALDQNHPRVLEELAALYSHLGDPLQELEMRKRRLLCGASLVPNHVLAAARVIAQLARPSEPLTQDWQLVAALFRRFEPVAQPSERLEFAECLYAIDGLQSEARDRLQAVLPAAHAGDQIVELRLLRGTELPGLCTVVSSKDDRLLQALILEQASVLAGVQWCPWLPQSKTVLRGFFTRRLRTLREDPNSQLLLHSSSQIVARLPADSSRTVAGTGVLVGGQENYYHFIAEHLSRLATLDALGLSTADTLLVVTAELPVFARELLHLVGYPDDRLLQVRAQDNLIFERLIAPLPPVRGGAEISPAVPAWVRREFAPYMAQGEPLKLYISRARATRRGVTNEQEVVEVLRRDNFQIVYPEELNVLQQIALYSRAREVVAPGGAALTNMMFMPPGSRMTMINNRHLPPAAQKLFFEPLARACGVRFSIVSGSPRKFTTNRVLDADVEVPIAELRASLSSS
jgi:capsular polysaccharide biosynthesis protein